MEKFSPFVVIAVCLLAVVPEPVRSDGFENFVEIKSANYTTWLKAENLDPSPIDPTLRQLDGSNAAVNVQLNISDLGVLDHSNDFDYYVEKASLLDGIIVYNGATYSNVTFFGTYSANGTLLASIPFSGEGQFNITVGGAVLSYCWLNFVVAPGGYLNYTGAGFPNSFLGENDFHDINFPGLWDSGEAAAYKDFIIDAVYKAFAEHYRYGRETYDKTLLGQYYKQLFDETPLSDIIGTTLPPVSTTEDLPITTEITSTTTTEDPCKRLRINGNTDDVEVLEETILDTRTSVNKKGEPVRITKKIVITEERLQL